MQTINIYTTPQCGFCKSLKAKLDKKSIPYTNHDVTTSEKDLSEMRELSDGALSVPVTVLNKGKDDQKVLLGYPDAVKALGLEEKAVPAGRQETGGNEQKDTATLTCPQCGHKQKGEIPITSCVPFYVCESCKATIKAHGKDCCVFCSYADKDCPLKKNGGDCEDGVCNV